MRMWVEPYESSVANYVAVISPALSLVRKDIDCTIILDCCEVSHFFLRLTPPRDNRRSCLMKSTIKASIPSSFSVR